MPVKQEIKSKYPPLTEKEKREIIARHKELVDKCNAVLPDGQKVSYDKNILRRLNDPDEVALYRIGNEMKEVEAKQAKIREDLEKKFGKYESSKTNPFARNFNYYLRVDNSEDAKKHNEKMYNDYLHSPEKLVYIRYKDALNINPQEILDCKNSKAKLAEYYKKNYSALKDAFEYGNCFRNFDDATPGMKEGYDAIASQLNYMGRIEKQVAIIGSTYDYFAMPSITSEQAETLLNNAGAFRELDPNNEVFIPYLFNELEKGKEDIFTFFEGMKKNGAEFSKGSIMKYKAINKDKYNGFEKETQLTNVLLEEDPNSKTTFKIKERTDDEIKRIRLITCNASYQYANEWRKRFEQKTNLGSADPDKCKSRLQLGFFSRHLKGNSRQYDILMESYKNFHDPRSKDYLNEDKLKEAATNYRSRKAGQGHTGRGNSIDDRRMKFADDIIATCDQCKAERNQIFKEIDEDFMYGYPPKKEPFLSSKDVEEKEYEYKVDDKELNKEIDFEKDMENVNDISLQ